MKVKCTIQEDTVVEYLKFIQQSVNNQREHLVKEATKTLATSVAHQGDVWGVDEYGDYGMQWGGAAPFETGALLQSGLNPNQQVLSATDEYRTVIDLYWTGMYADYSWWEFREDSKTYEPPEVDYALFQETGSRAGIPHADSKALKARHKGFFKTMVNDKGVQERIKYNVANEYMKMLRKK